MSKQALSTSDAPAPIGVYSQGIQSNGFIFTSGQIPLTKEGVLIKNDFKAESLQVIQNIEAILKKGGSKLSDIVKLTVYLTDLSLFPELNKIFEQRIIGILPARSVVEVSRLPMNVRIEMEAIALKK